MPGHRDSFKSTVVLGAAIEAIEENSGPKAAVFRISALADEEIDDVAKVDKIRAWMKDAGYAYQPDEFVAAVGPLFVADRGKYEAAWRVRDVAVRHALQRIADRLGPGEGFQEHFAAVARRTRQEELVDLEMMALGYRWNQPRRVWEMPRSRRLGRLATRVAIVLGAAAAVVGVFLVPTTAAAAARVAYVSATVSLLSAAVPPLWRWSRH